MADEPSFWKSAKSTFSAVGVIAFIVYVIAYFVMWVLDAGMERIIPGPYAVPLVVTAAAMLFLFLFAIWVEECNTAKAAGERNEHWNTLGEEQRNLEQANAFIRRYVPQENITEHLQDLEETRSKRMTALLNVLEKGPVEEIERSVKAVNAHLESVRELRDAVRETEQEVEEAIKLAQGQKYETDTERWRSVAEEKEVRQKTAE